MTTWQLEEPGQKVEPAVGDRVEIRRFSKWVPLDQQGDKGSIGKWELAPYQLLDGTEGEMLAVNYKVELHSGEDSMPPVITLDPKLAGIYAIYCLMPALDWKPVLGEGIEGVDIALDGERFYSVSPKIGFRKGRRLCETNREFCVLFRYARMDRRKIQIRVPFGVPSVQCAGLVRACLSALRFVRVDAMPVRKPSTKKVMVVCDGFSHYYTAGLPGEDLDLRLVDMYRDSDVNMLMLQTSNTGLSLWKSDVTSYLGEGMSREDLEGKRVGDIRASNYLRWAVESGRDPIRIQSEACLKNQMEFHLSIRANLFFQDPNPFMKDCEPFLNGRWWVENPDVRLPGGVKLDYEKKKARDFILALFSEALERYTLDGINLDMTRWPPIFDPKRHSPELVLTVARELRELVDRHNQRTNSRVKLSMLFVEGYHAGMTLEEQGIDFERLMEQRLLDFVCVEAWDIRHFVDIAHRYATPCLAIQDGESVYYPGGFRADPLWKTADGEVQNDPRAGEEFLEQPPINSSPAAWELNIAVDRAYRAEADGMAFVNYFIGCLPLRGAGQEDAIRQGLSRREVFGQEEGDYLFLRED